jgi:hypothetical protein
MAFWTAFLGTGACCGAAGLATDAPLVGIAAVTIARAPGGAASAVQAQFGAGTTGAATGWCGTGAGAEDADLVSRAATAVAVDAAAIRATDAAIAVRHACWGRLGRRLPVLVLALP